MKFIRENAAIITFILMCISASYYFGRDVLNEHEKTLELHLEEYKKANAANFPNSILTLNALLDKINSVADNLDKTLKTEDINTLKAEISELTLRNKELNERNNQLQDELKAFCIKTKTIILHSGQSEELLNNTFSIHLVNINADKSIHINYVINNLMNENTELKLGQKIQLKSGTKECTFQAMKIDYIFAEFKYFCNVTDVDE